MIKELSNGQSDFGYARRNTFSTCNETAGIHVFIALSIPLSPYSLSLSLSVHDISNRKLLRSKRNFCAAICDA
jgi:hypothetical protein